MPRNMPGATTPSYMNTDIPYRVFPRKIRNDRVPDAQECRELWQHYAMLSHIGEHSTRVAEFACALAQRAQALGKPDVRDVTLAAGLLHDIAKSYTVKYGGSHAQIGASWVMGQTGNPVIAQAVMHHVWWPWAFPKDLASPTFFVLYADKRVMHDSVVDMHTRYEDLLMRYGQTEASRAAIVAGNEHARDLEQRLSAYLEIDLNACTLAGGRLVERA